MKKYIPIINLTNTMNAPHTNVMAIPFGDESFLYTCLLRNRSMIITPLNSNAASFSIAITTRHNKYNPFMSKTYHGTVRYLADENRYAVSNVTCGDVLSELVDEATTKQVEGTVTGLLYKSLQLAGVEFDTNCYHYDTTAVMPNCFELYECNDEVMRRIRIGFKDQHGHTVVNKIF